jgi:hypothetical protein
LTGCEGVARIQRIAAELEAGRSPPVVQSRTRGDVDRDDTWLVHVGREHVAAEANLLNLPFRRQPAAAEPVDAEHGTGPADIAECLFHLVGVVGELVDLLLVHDRGERVAARIARALPWIAPHVHGLRERGDGELDLAPVLARPHPHVAQVSGLESGRFDVNGVAARLKPAEHGVAAGPGVERRLSDQDARAHDHRAAGIDNRDAQRRVRAGLLRGRDTGPQHQHQTDEHAHVISQADAIGIRDSGPGIGDWELGIGKRIPNPRTPISDPAFPTMLTDRRK